ncbi:3-dehydroquinate dehydratase, putative (AroD) [Sulfolobus islandicus Y.G.57.14]|jgi:3-dehydroquinate dehydratase-1|uniref:3-dehydroquinate dehydratase n=9 Tax=Saccharolobus islandicus TaxID=43080 RepID=M9UAL9_SACIS|nr:type I 3-dehydroquinate dehydratase [Sulfolobus islandicus]ACP35927.1 3-dehydroquinate dehydratase [Sulfolobus islandicus L.S.2.15]ACP38537.1 3-dehydroquinate dehydratase, putative (AroD) [Sulfolobus islandicus M.14.25]ACP46165.1 3-dehydroquinate dehydratase, putative (AroD) [Sulfolobus islandicus Y.G.57.14]ACP55781.1 3-dehydroquinate dehydratase, putative (AroD) [Sulfolobus islandicus M.16.27]ACR42443.1 3-dehydroquinate dehydratase, putative (AroD) [Sulfolobus islandicus M.16.4]
MRPLIVASLPIKKIEDLKLIGNFLDADLIELRLDYLKDREVSVISDYFEFLDKYKNKLIITLRDKAEGGINELADELKISLLKELYDKQFLYDVEVSFLQKHNVPYDNAIVSIHYFNYLPTSEKVKEIVSKFYEKAFSVKIAVLGLKGYKEVILPLLEYENVTVIPMSNNPLERIAVGLLGSKLVYSYAIEPLAQGQLYYKKVIQIFDYINNIITSSSVT